MPTSFSYWSLLRYFAATAVTAATITLSLLLSLLLLLLCATAVTAANVTLLLLLSLLLLLPLLLLLSHHFATDTLLQILSLSGVVELTT